MSQCSDPSAHGAALPRQIRLERVSIELTRACHKACDFCYNGSTPQGETSWSVDDVLQLARSCIEHGLRSLSFGGGEPLEYPGLCELLRRLDGQCFRSLTTNGLALDQYLAELVAARPDKIHVSLHYPEHRAELERTLRQLRELTRVGLRTGVNLLVRRSRLGAARDASRQLQDAGVGLERLLFIPMRGADTPSPREVAQVAGARHFQSVTCLVRCGISPRFASIDWNKRIGWCSYTKSRRTLGELSHQGLVAALRGQQLESDG